MKKPDYLVMCSNCEVRIHPDDYQKHKIKCESPVYPIYPIYPIYPLYPAIYNPYPIWEWQPTPAPYCTGTAADKITIGDFPSTSENVTLTGTSAL